MLPRDKSHNSMGFEINRLPEHTTRLKKLVEAEQEACKRTRKTFEPRVALDHPRWVLWVQHSADIFVEWLVALTRNSLSWDIQN
jgi:hypothetical protein